MLQYLLYFFLINLMLYVLDSWTCCGGRREVAQDWAKSLTLPKGDSLTLWKGVGLNNRPNKSNKSTKEPPLVSSLATITFELDLLHRDTKGLYYARKLVVFGFNNLTT